MMSDKLCPECGHPYHMHRNYVCWGDTKRMDEEADWTNNHNLCNCQLDQEDISVKIVEVERDEARDLARRFYRERNEARRLAANLAGYCPLDGMEESHYHVSDGYQFCFKWCQVCGGDMQVVRAGRFQCVECGK